MNSLSLSLFSVSALQNYLIFFFIIIFDSGIAHVCHCFFKMYLFTYLFNYFIAYLFISLLIIFFFFLGDNLMILQTTITSAIQK